MRVLILTLLLALPASSQITLKAHTAGQSSTDQPFALPAINTTGASVLLVCEQAYTQTSAPTDTLGNTYTRVGSVGSDANASLWAVFAPVTSANHVITVNGNYPAGAAAAYSGVASGPDQLATYFNYSYNPTSLGPVTPANANELVFTCMGMSGGYAGTVDAPLTVLDSSSNGLAVTASQIQTTAATVNPTWHPTSGSKYSAITATFFSAQTPAPFAMATTALPEAFGGSVYSYQLRTGGGVSPNTWAKTGTLPSGWTLSTGGLLSSGSTITSASSSPNLVFTATDSQGHTASTSPLTLTVAAAPLAITTTSCPTGTQRQVYAGCNLAATGGTTPYTFGWSRDPNNVGLPEGLSQSTTTGAITGTVTGQGIYQTTFTVTDAVGTVISSVINLPINGDNSFLASGFFPPDHFFHGGFDLTGLAADTAVYVIPISGHPQVVGGQYVSSGGIPFNFVPATQPYIPVSCPSQTCYQQPVSSGPFSATTAIEDTANAAFFANGSYGSGADGHALVLQAAGNGHPANLFESWHSSLNTAGNGWWNESNFSWDLSQYSWVNAAGSADAAGLCILCFTPNYDETMSAGGFKRPMRMAFPGGQLYTHYFWPATDNPHGGGGTGGNCAGGYQDPDTNGLWLQSNPPTNCGATPTRLPFGAIYRIKASSFAAPPNACLTNTTTNPQAAAVFRSLRKYGAIVADQGSFWQFTFTSDARWSDSDLACLRNISGADLEMVNMTPLITTDSNGRPTSMKVKNAQPIRPLILNNLLP